jgi:L-serine dehydratase
MSDAVSIFNDVLGPVMRGPSSSHTAGSYHVAVLARALLGDKPVSIRVTFDPEGSYARVFRQQSVDRAFAAGFLDWPLTDRRFHSALAAAEAEGLGLRFDVESLPGSGHPNEVAIDLSASDGARLSLRARSIGGGAVEVTRVDEWAVRLTGRTCDVLVEADAAAAREIRSLLQSDQFAAAPTTEERRGATTLIHARRYAPLAPGQLAALAAMPRALRVLQAPPIAFMTPGRPLFENAAEMVSLARDRGCSLGRLALASECALLKLTEREALDEMLRRLDVMLTAVNDGLAEDQAPMQLLAPSARQIMEADRVGRLALGGLHTRAAARAMAVMQITSGMGVVCAAPTGGSAGTLAGVVATLMEELGLDRVSAAFALFAASAIGVVLAARATFAAEVAGCQVEIGAAGAMAAAAVVEARGGTPQQASDAAAVALQNTMGSVCDLVQGIVEIPCHTRNAVAASSAFVCADLTMGGYVNPIPLDETIDAAYAVGRALPSELRCTALGGLAMTPSALRLGRHR